ncbi:alcohol dehydrogenase [Allopusillimonas soli]|uniref:Alcohol dehydrogenase catalytic domain-containing protein n=1 Tax=Allopusillimonas soli TaxID=659016 RepID=A0A853FD30_9BURK|nr:alcohol dehydrogenase catalytic domain-containing protein [Allopusillimonas soli]NYT38715.1 alcohol dehydrogenase catalytic domain-containing protein [Allopusillimonas soli]TEA71588.1 alcohol dehydrogenase [Allopusillimonas soli]
MNKTYRAMQVGRSGTLEIVARDAPDPMAGEVLIEVEACGVCGVDLADIEKAAAARLSRVPGHEVVGRIAALGPYVPPLWAVGQRVGVGRLGGHCNECDQCRQGRFQLCRNQQVVGVDIDGGYAEMMLARCAGLVSIPDELDAEDAAPILCAGVATFNALKKCGAEAGDLVVVLGIGGLGHMAVQYARRMGFRVVAVGRGADIADDALALGAHVYIDNRQEDAAARIKDMGGAQAMITMIDHMETISALISALSPKGRLVVLNPGKSPLSVPLGMLIGGERSVMGSITGSPYESEKALSFSVLADVRPRIERMPLEQAGEACQRMASGDAKFRVVLTMTAQK